ncbi:MAG TPA: hypothetical protein VG870_07875 [Chitinophagaceae bacterium]|nr:hypothetical protein [Chitinophagaceae bacterium]
MKRIVLLLVACTFLVTAGGQAGAQQTGPVHRIALFAPLYLDSAFDASGTYRYDDNFPRFINPGLEFYEGAQLALDSMARENLPLEVYLYDTRSQQQSLKNQLEEAHRNQVELILAYCNGPDLGSLAYAAALYKIPFINVNLPADGGVYNNPYFVILSPTLKTHVEGIYRYLQKRYPLDDLVVFRKKGRMEDVIRSYLDEAGKSTASVPLKYRLVELPDSFSTDQLRPYLGTTGRTVCLAGSLDENFMRQLALKLAPLSKQGSISLLGMPTMENLSRDFSRPEYKGLELVYSTPFYDDRSGPLSQTINDFFATRFYARPSDLVLRGYEAAWRFAHLLVRYPGDLGSNLSRKEFDILHGLDIQPVINKKTLVLDYYENKKLFFITWQDGIIKGVN